MSAADEDIMGLTTRYVVILLLSIIVSSGAAAVKNGECTFSGRSNCGGGDMPVCIFERTSPKICIYIENQ